MQVVSRQYKVGISLGLLYIKVTFSWMMKNSCFHRAKVFQGRKHKLYKSISVARKYINLALFICWIGAMTMWKSIVLKTCAVNCWARRNATNKNVGLAAVATQKAVGLKANITSARANLSFPQVHASPHMVLVYTIPNKMQAILPIKVDLDHFGGVPCNLWKICHATSQYYVPIVKSGPNFGDAYFITFSHISNRWL